MTYRAASKQEDAAEQREELQNRMKAIDVKMNTQELKAERRKRRLDDILTGQRIVVQKSTSLKNLNKKEVEGNDKRLSSEVKATCACALAAEVAKAVGINEPVEEIDKDDTKSGLADGIRALEMCLQSQWTKNIKLRP